MQRYWIAILVFSLAHNLLLFFTIVRTFRSSIATNSLDRTTQFANFTAKYLRRRWILKCFLPNQFPSFTPIVKPNILSIKLTSRFLRCFHLSLKSEFILLYCLLNRCINCFFPYRSPTSYPSNHGFFSFLVNEKLYVISIKTANYPNSLNLT